MPTPGEISKESFKKVSAWRQHPLLSNTMRHAAPGFLLGLGAFVVVAGIETATAPKKAKH